MVNKDNSADYFVEEAKKAWKNGDKKGAVSAFAKAFKIDKTHPMAIYYMGFLSMEFFDYQPLMVLSFFNNFDSLYHSDPRYQKEIEIVRKKINELNLLVDQYKANDFICGDLAEITKLTKESPHALKFFSKEGLELDAMTDHYNFSSELVDIAPGEKIGVAISPIEIYPPGNFNNAIEILVADENGLSEGTGVVINYTSRTNGWLSFKVAGSYEEHATSFSVPEGSEDGLIVIEFCKNLFINFLVGKYRTSLNKQFYDIAIRDSKSPSATIILSKLRKPKKLFVRVVGLKARFWELNKY